MDMSIAASSPRSYAAEGLRQMGSARNQAAREIGDAYLGSIAASATGPEQVVAKTMHEATLQRLKGVSAATAQMIALQALAAGVSGTAGAALARIGLRVLDAVSNSRDAVTVTGSILAHMDPGGARNSTDILTETVRIAGTNCLDESAAVQVFRDGLQALQEPGSERMEARLARFGLAARQHGNLGDAQAMAQIVVQQIEKYTADDAIRGLAHQAFEEAASSHSAPWGSPFGSPSDASNRLGTRLQELLAAAVRLDEQAAAARTEQIEKMAGSPEGGSIEVQDEAVVIGGVRVDRNQRPTP